MSVDKIFSRKIIKIAPSVYKTHWIVVFQALFVFFKNKKAWKFFLQSNCCRKI